MNMIERNNKRHQEALDVVEQYKQQGGIVRELGVTKSDHRSHAPKPKRFVKAHMQAKVDSYD